MTEIIIAAFFFVPFPLSAQMVHESFAKLGPFVMTIYLVGLSS